LMVSLWQHLLFLYTYCLLINGFFKNRMKIHREGYNTIAVVALLAVISVIAVRYFFPQQGLWHFVFYGLVTLTLIAVIQFFRSPSRQITLDDAHVLCPADGEVVAIEETLEPEYFRQPMKLVSIFMSPLNVHINRYPVGGKVSYMKYHPGKFLVAWHPKSSELNERTSIVLENPSGSSLLVRQVAGAVARRIVCYSLPGEEVKQGEELGFIKFGSRVDLFLPLDVDVKVKVGDKVKGGESIIAQFGSL
jgi:phosphatidylserine decarboxylase